MWVQTRAKNLSIRSKKGKWRALDKRVNTVKVKTKSSEKEIVHVAREEKRGIGEEAH